MSTTKLLAQTVFFYAFSKQEVYRVEEVFKGEIKLCANCHYTVNGKDTVGSRVENIM